GGPPVCAWLSDAAGAPGADDRCNPPLAADQLPLVGAAPAPTSSRLRGPLDRPCHRRAGSCRAARELGDKPDLVKINPAAAATCHAAASREAAKGAMCDRRRIALACRRTVRAHDRVKPGMATLAQLALRAGRSRARPRLTPVTGLAITCLVSA